MQQLIQLYQSGRFGEVIEASSKLLKRHPKSIGLWNLQGASYAAIKDYNNALKSFRKAEKIAPKNADVSNNIGNVLSSTKNFKEAEKYFKRAIISRPGFASARANLAAALRDQGRLDDAIKNYKEAIKVDPNFPVSLNGLGSVFLKKTMYAEALEAFSKAITIDVNYADAHSNMATCLAKMKKFEKALEHHRIAVGLSPKDMDFRFAMATTLCALGEEDEAVNLCMKIVSLDHNHEAAKQLIGSVLLKNEEFEKAEEFFLKLLRSRREDEQALSFLVEALRGLRKSREAVILMRDRINAGENSFESLDRLGDFLLKEKQFLEAQEAYRYAVELYPDDARAHIGLGEVKRKKGDYFDAIASFHAAAELSPGVADVFVKLGRAYILTGNMNEGERWLKYAWRMEPLNVKAIRQLASLPIGCVSMEEILELDDCFQSVRGSMSGYNAAEIASRISLHRGDLKEFCLQVKTANEKKLETLTEVADENKKEALRWNATRLKISQLGTVPVDEKQNLPRLTITIGPSTSGKSTLQRLISMNNDVVLRDEAVNFSILQTYSHDRGIAFEGAALNGIACG